MANNDVAIRFREVTFAHDDNKEILDEVSFAVRRGSKVALMGQNGAGKSTLFDLIRGRLKPQIGHIHLGEGMTVACAEQTVPREKLSQTVREFLGDHFTGEEYELDKKISEVLTAVNLEVPIDRKMESFSGGQQARLLLAAALIADPDILLLDEPTNNLDIEGIGHLLSFLMMFDKTLLIISHDAEFLNMLVDGVLYLDIHTHKVEQYVGDYHTVVEEIKKRIEKENRLNAQFAKKIKENKEKINYFQNKGGKMRLLAKKLREEVAEMEAAKVQVRREDKAIRDFVIPAQEEVTEDILVIDRAVVVQDHLPREVEVNVKLRRNQHLLLKGPNGIGKTTLLEKISAGEIGQIHPDIRVGYYRQDFSTLDFGATVFEALLSVMREKDEEVLRSTAAGFLLTRKVMDTKIGLLSEGQKGLVAFTQLVLMQPGLLILDEPTNHINFRHLPVIARALDQYRGAMILVSHSDEFVSQIRIDEELDLSKFLS